MLDLECKLLTTRLPATAAIGIGTAAAYSALGFCAAIANSAYKLQQSLIHQLLGWLRLLPLVVMLLSAITAEGTLYVSVTLVAELSSAVQVMHCPLSACSERMLLQTRGSHWACMPLRSLNLPAARLMTEHLHNRLHGWPRTPSADIRPVEAPVYPDAPRAGTLSSVHLLRLDRDRRAMFIACRACCRYVALEVPPNCSQQELLGLVLPSGLALSLISGAYVCGRPAGLVMIPVPHVLNYAWWLTLHCSHARNAEPERTAGPSAVTCVEGLLAELGCVLPPDPRASRGAPLV